MITAHAGNTALRRDALTETYEDVRKLIYKTVADFVRRYNGSRIPELTYHELAAIANELYVDAYDSYRAERGPFPQWVRFYIYKNLTERLRNNLRRQNQVSIGRLTDEMEAVITSRPEFQLAPLLERLSWDGRIVVLLVFEVPISLRCALLEQEQEEETPKQIRQALRECLRDFGWTPQRIARSFREIKKAL